MSAPGSDLDGDILAYLADDLDPERQAALDRMLCEDPAAATRFVHLCRHELALATALRGTAAVIPRPHPRRRPGRRPAWRWLAAAALVAVSVGLVAILALSASGSVQASGATISAVAGRSTVGGEEAAPGMPLLFDARLVVGEDAHLAFAYQDGSSLELGPGSQAVLPADPGKLVVLERGGIAAEVAPQPAGRPLRVATPQGRAEVVGTRFRLVVAAATTRLDVSEGTVRLSRSADGATRLVQAGFACTIAGSAGAMDVEWSERLAQRLPSGARVLLQADLSAWEGEMASPPGFAGLAALGGHAPQPGTRFMGEVRSPVLAAGPTTGPDHYLAIRCLADGFRPGDHVKIMLKDAVGTIYHGEIAVAGGRWTDAAMRLDGSFVDLNHAAKPMPAGMPIAQIVLLAVAPDGQVGVAGPRLWLGEVVVCSGPPPAALLPVRAP